MPTHEDNDTMKPLNAVCILRVSSKKQLDGEGIENQRQDVVPYCKKKGYSILREFVLSETAADAGKRDTFDGILDYCLQNHGKIAVVVIWKVDRFSRGGLNDYYQLKAYLASHGIRLESATENIDDTASGEVMEGMLALIARYENRSRVARTIGAEKIMTREGYWCRSAPTGFVNGAIETGINEKGKPVKRPILKPHPDEKQWRLLCEGLKKQLTGQYKISHVAKELREQGLVTRETVRNGKRFCSPMTVATWTNICKNPLYGGMICEKWTNYEFVRAKFNGPLTPDEWHELQRVITGTRRAGMPVKYQRQRLDLPLRRFLRCPHCQSPVRGAPSTGKSGKKFYYYDCKNKECKFRVQAEEAHTLFTSHLQKIAPSNEVLKLFREIVLDVWDDKYRSMHSDSIQMAKKASFLNEEKQSIIELMKKSHENAEILAALQKDFERVNKEYTLATMERNKTEIQTCDAETVVRYCEYFLKNAYELWDIAPVVGKYALQGLPYPNGVSYSALQDLRTPELSPIYAALTRIQENQDVKSSMAEQHGRELNG